MQRSYRKLIHKSDESVLVVSLVSLSLLIFFGGALRFVMLGLALVITTGYIIRHYGVFRGALHIVIYMISAGAIYKYIII